MYTADTMRDRYAAGNLQTASGPKLVVMCFDRLDRDLTTALRSIESGDHYETNSSLGHAQDLLGEMAAMLDIEAWEHANALLAVYDYVMRRLAQANTAKEPALVREIQSIVTEIGDGFRAAAGSLAATTVEPSEVTGERPRLSVQA